MDGTAAARPAGAAATARPSAGGSVRGPSSRGGRCRRRGRCAQTGLIVQYTVSGESYLPSGPGPKALARPRITPRQRCLPSLLTICYIKRSGPPRKTNDSWTLET